MSQQDDLTGVADASSVKDEPVTGLHSPVALNFCDIDQLILIPGIGKKLAVALLSVRENSGNITPEILSVICRKKFTEDELALIDFTSNKCWPAEEKEDELIEASKGLSLKREMDVASRLMAKGPQMDSQGQEPTSGEDASCGDPYLSSRYTPRDIDFSSRRERNPWHNLEEQNIQHVGCHGEADIGKPSYPRGYGAEHERCRPSLLIDTLKSLPRHMTFDGVGSWKAFILKFNRFAEASNWSEGEKLNGLCWCLTGKAMEYFVILNDTEEVDSYRSLCLMLEARYGQHDLPAAFQAQFQQACQNPDESLEDFGERLLILAVRAFKGLPVSFIEEQVISRFCQGLLDKDAGHHVCMQSPSSVQGAIQIVRKYQQVYKAMHGKARRDTRRRDDENRDVFAVEATSVSSSSTLDNLTVMRAIQQLEQKFDKVIGLGNHKKGPYLCFNCGKEGHFRRNCPDRGSGK
jgi:hypothetical protein